MSKKTIFFILVSLLALSAIVCGQQYQMGCNFDDEAYDKTLVTAPLMRGDYDGMPASVSLKDYSPYPGDQGSYGTCTAWGSAYAARTISWAIKNGWTDRRYITQHAFSPSFVYSQIKFTDDNDCSNGSYPGDAAELISEVGVPMLSYFPYDCYRIITDYDVETAGEYRAADYKRLFDIDYSDKVTLTKKSLSEKKPVIFALRCPDSFFSPEGVWNPTSQDYSAENLGGHAMCVIGYDDNKYGGAFEIMNSWGDDWGNDGYVWVRYDDFQHFCKYGFELIEENLPQLAGELRFMKSNGEDMEAEFNGEYYEMVEAYPSGTAFQLFISNNEPAYVYAFGSDNTNKSYQIFPHDAGISPHLSYSQNNVAIPDEEHFVMMDATTGTDFFCFLYSQQKLDFNNIMDSMERKSGDFPARLTQVLGEKLIDANEINYDWGEINFEAKCSGGYVVPVIVEIEHTD